jgi:hypothetical protein
MRSHRAKKRGQLGQQERQLFSHRSSLIDPSRLSAEEAVQALTGPREVIPAAELTQRRGASEVTLAATWTLALTLLLTALALALALSAGEQLQQLHHNAQQCRHWILSALTVLLLEGGCAAVGGCAADLTAKRQAAADTTNPW